VNALELSALSITKNSKNLQTKRIRMSCFVRREVLLPK